MALLSHLALLHPDPLGELHEVLNGGFKLTGLPREESFIKETNKLLARDIPVMVGVQLGH